MISEETSEKYFDFLSEYAELCRKHGCLVIALGFQKESVTGIDEGLAAGLDTEQILEIMENNFELLFNNIEDRIQ